MSKTITEQGNFMVCGSTGSCKTVFCAQMVQAILSGQRSDGGSKSIEKNDNDSGERHDNQG
jgi:type II secretory ATPase GspE/PulE/Tfp pilus assembly ATPase PilB-like protein